MTRSAAIVLLTLVLSMPLGLAAAEATAEPATAEKPAEVDLVWGVQVPLRDGVHLNATVYKPAAMAAPLPAVFTLTPYTADSYHERGFYFARHGYVFVLVDARGRGSSEGAFTPFAQEARDGYDVVEWLARQSWCNGKVAMWGGSYAGYDQWATAKEFPPHLATIVPAAAAFPGVDFPFGRQIFYPYDLQWTTLTSGATANFNLFGETAFWISKYSRLYREHRPFVELPEIVGNRGTAFETWVRHPHPDAYWDAMAPTAADFARLELPILTITGAYDGDQRGALEFYRRHLTHASPAAQARHFLVIGPWDHAGTRTPRKSIGGWEFGDASLVDLNDLHRRWYDWTMKDGPRPEFLEKRVAYYLAGAEEWKYVDGLPVATEQRRLYLGSPGGDARDAFHSGTLTAAPPADPEPDRYLYDPLDTRPAELEEQQNEAYITDQRAVLALDGDGLVYGSEPLAQETEVTGRVKAVLWIALDVPDTDFEVDLYEILPDGRSVALSQDLLRARYRLSPREPHLVEPGKVERYDFDAFTFFSRRLAKGSRLRLVVTSPNSIYLEKNYNAGGVVAEESGADARTAHVVVYHDADHPSYVELPIVEAGAAEPSP
jgi:uncharacterized protein